MKKTRTPRTFDQPALYERVEAARYIGYSQSLFDQEKNAGRFPAPVKAGKYTRAQLDDYISQLETFGDWNPKRYVEAMKSRRAVFCQSC